MALIKCPECGKEISDQVKKCPSCGYKEKKSINKKVFFIFGGVLVLVAIIVGVTLFFTKEKPLTQLEQYAVECIKDYKSMLKNTNSLQVHEIRWQEFEEEKNSYIIYIDESGQNSFGGNTRTIIRYVADEDGVRYTGNSDDEDSDDFIKRIVASKIADDWPVLKEDDNSIISVDRVMKKVN